MSDREFHDRAKSLKPDQAIKPTRYWVGILYHDKKASEVSHEAEFLWIKAHGVRSIYFSSDFTKTFEKSCTVSKFKFSSNVVRGDKIFRHD